MKKAKKSQISFCQKNRKILANCHKTTVLNATREADKPHRLQIDRIPFSVICPRVL